MCYLCGDINIDLLKYENHKGTRDFLNALFSLGMFPRPQANLCSVQVGSSYRGTKIYLHELVHGSELILKLKVLHLFCSHFRDFLH